MNFRPRTGSLYRPLALLAMALAIACGLAAQASPVGDRVVLGRWSIDRTEVTLGQFSRFVQATGMRTRAEQEGGGFEYVAGWQRRPGWNWRRPDGTPPKAPTCQRCI